jgi:hypothetical protein
MVSYPVYYSYKLQPFLKRLKAEQRLISDLLNYYRYKGRGFWVAKLQPKIVIATF